MIAAGNKIAWSDVDAQVDQSSIHTITTLKLVHLKNVKSILYEVLPKRIII